MISEYEEAVTCNEFNPKDVDMFDYPSMSFLYKQDVNENIVSYEHKNLVNSHHVTMFQRKLYTSCNYYVETIPDILYPRKYCDAVRRNKIPYSIKRYMQCDTFDLRDEILNIFHRSRIISYSRMMHKED